MSNIYSLDIKTPTSRPDDFDLNCARSVDLSPLQAICVIALLEREIEHLRAEILGQIPSDPFNQFLEEARASLQKQSAGGQTPLPSPFGDSGEEE